MESHANVHGIAFGTGYSIHESTILPAVETAQHEVILITCFWARSQTLDALNESLLKLSSAALQRGKRVKVRIGFSSLSLLQKLFHTQSPEGHTYPPSTWQKKLGLLAAEDLSGLDLEVKSIFFLPFSVWHPKFVIVDRKKVFLPSCNVSWEDWFEGCVTMDGPVVECFLSFWREHWASENDRKNFNPEIVNGISTDLESVGAAGDRQSQVATHLDDMACEFLPSPHHRNPNFRLPWLQRAAAPPRTPLNQHLLNLFANARKEIFIQTPNLTAHPCLSAIRDALQRGIDVSIVTSEKLMVLEQLVTAGGTTARCVKHLISQHETLLRQRSDEEAGLVKPGRLSICYYMPLAVAKSGVSGGAEPVQSHLKLTIVDEETAVFGSGNMDRASWYTSQELGVSFHAKELVAQVRQSLAPLMQDRVKTVYDSG